MLVLGGPGRGELGPAEEVAGLLTLDPLVGVCGRVVCLPWGLTHPRRRVPPELP